MSHRDLSARVTYYLIRIYRIDPDDSKNNNNSSSRESELGIPLNDPGCNQAVIGIEQFAFRRSELATGSSSSYPGARTN